MQPEISELRLVQQDRRHVNTSCSKQKEQEFCFFFFLVCFFLVRFWGGFLVCLNQGTLGTKTCPSGASLKPPTAQQPDKRATHGTSDVGDSFCWLCREHRDRAGGTKARHYPCCWRESLLVLQHGGMPPGHVAQPPAPPAPAFFVQGGPSSQLALPPSIGRAGSARTHGTHRTDRRSDTSACTGTHAHRRGAHTSTGSLPAGQPHPPSLEPVALKHWVTAGSRALPAARGSLGALAADTEESITPESHRG